MVVCTYCMEACKAVVWLYVRTVWRLVRQLDGNVYVWRLVRQLYGNVYVWRFVRQLYGCMYV